MKLIISVVALLLTLPIFSNGLEDLENDVEMSDELKTEHEEGIQLFIKDFIEILVLG